MSNFVVMNKDKEQVAKRILDLTLEIIHLVTGEDYVFVKKSGDGVTHKNGLHVSESSSKTQSPIMVFTPHSLIYKSNNGQKILELTNQIIELLTGEVPIRCDDVTVYFSMDEWEYIEGHKDLYRAAMMEKYPQLSSVDESVGKILGFHTSISSVDCLSLTKNNLGPGCSSTYTSIMQNRKCPVKVIQQADTCEVRDSVDTKVYTSTEHTKIEYPSTYIKEEPVLCKEENLPDIYTLTDHPQTEDQSTLIKEETTSYEGDITDIDIDTSTEYTMVHIKEEAWEEGNVMDNDVSTQTELASTYIKEEPVSCEEPNILDLYTHTEHMDREYILTHINQESLSCQQLNITEHTEFPLTVYNNTTKGENSILSINQGSKVDANYNRKLIYPAHKRADGTYNCHLCDIYFTSKIDLRKHQVVHKGKKLSCSECGKKFSFKSQLTKHQIIHSGDKPYSCTHCGKRFVQKSDLIPHQRSHTGEKPFSCSECGKSFTQKSNLVRHQKTHTGEKPFPCSECGSRFTQRSELLIHQRVHTGEKPFACSECGKCFSHKSVLIKHQIIHTGDKPFACSVCEKCFVQKSDLIIHQRIHTGEKPFSCSVCAKCFSQKSVLVNHQKIHTGEKPFSCSVCGKDFVHKSDLMIHQRIHTGEKPFSCSLCGRRFKLKSHLVSHQKFHTGERPFTCSACGKSYTLKSHLVAHQKVHGIEKAFTSPECNSFPT